MFLVLLNRGLRRSLGVGSGTSTQAGVLDFHPPKNFRIHGKQGASKDLQKDSKAKVYTPPKQGGELLPLRE